MADCFSKSEMTDFLEQMKLPNGTPLVSVNTRAVNKYPNVLWTHTADMLASHVAGI